MIVMEMVMRLSLGLESTKYFCLVFNSEFRTLMPTYAASLPTLRPRRLRTRCGVEMIDGRGVTSI
jgi:hypothetical protein